MTETTHSPYADMAPDYTPRHESGYAEGGYAPPAPPVDKYAVSSAWSSANSYKEPFDYTLDGSRQTVMIRRLDMADILRLGLAGNLDFMTKALMADKKDSEEESKQSIMEVMSQGGENFAKMEEMINKVVTAGTLKPTLYGIPRDELARQKGLVYIDEIPFNDRMELFGVIFDSDGLSTFRGEQTDGVGDVANEPSVPLPANGPVELRSDNP
jgi:hypothetical protein